jgi:protein translocase SecG subunit
MSILTIIQSLLAILLIFIVTMQVKKDSSGLAGLMGNTTNNKNKSSNIDKATKYMLALILSFMVISFGVSYQKGLEHKSLITESSMQKLAEGNKDVK